MRFEGEDIDGGLDIVLRQFRGDIDVPLALDETVTLTVQAQVVGVSHEIHRASGTLSRTHVVRVKEVTVRE